MQSSGVKLERRTPDFVTGKIRPLRDHLVVKLLPEKLSTVICVAGRELHPVRGIVVAAGLGVYPKIYNPDRSKCWDSKAFRPCDVKVGDVVELGTLENGTYHYDFPKILIDNELHVFCREADVCCIVAD